MSFKSYNLILSEDVFNIPSERKKLIKKLIEAKATPVLSKHFRRMFESSGLLNVKTEDPSCLIDIDGVLSVHENQIKGI